MRKVYAGIFAVGSDSLTMRYPMVLESTLNKLYAESAIDKTQEFFQNIKRSIRRCRGERGSV